MRLPEHLQHACVPCVDRRHRHDRFNLRAIAPCTPAGNTDNGLERFKLEQNRFGSFKRLLHLPSDSVQALVKVLGLKTGLFGQCRGNLNSEASFPCSV